MGRAKGNPTPWQLLTDAALAYAAAETDKDYELASYRLRYAAQNYRENPGPQARKGNGAAGATPSVQHSTQPTR